MESLLSRPCAQSGARCWAGVTGGQWLSLGSSEWEEPGGSKGFTWALRQPLTNFMPSSHASLNPFSMQEPEGPSFLLNIIFDTLYVYYIYIHYMYITYI